MPSNDFYAKISVNFGLNVRPPEGRMPRKLHESNWKCI